MHALHLVRLFYEPPQVAVNQVVLLVQRSEQLLTR
jgi:hypothetical protein